MDGQTKSNCCNFSLKFTARINYCIFVTSGYVLDCFPSASEGWKSYSEQLHFLQDLEMKPDYIINLKVCFLMIP